MLVRVYAPQARNNYPPNSLNFSSPKGARIEVHNDCLSEDFICNLRECYMHWILEDVIITVFRALEFDNEAMRYVSLRMR